MLYHADAELTNHTAKASMKKKGDCVNEDMLKYAIFVLQIKESMWTIRHFGLLPKLIPRARSIMPDLNNIYQICVTAWILRYRHCRMHEFMNVLKDWFGVQKAQ